MIVVSLHQPWATLAAAGLKRIETRSWFTHHRGRLGIHSTQSFPNWAREFAESPAIQGTIESVFPELRGEWGDLFPTGAILGTVNLTDCLSTNERLHREDRGHLPPLGGTFENMVGDYSADRFMWLLEDAQRLVCPVPVRGWQRLWHYRETLCRETL